MRKQTVVFFLETTTCNESGQLKTVRTRLYFGSGQKFLNIVLEIKIVNTIVTMT